MPIMSDITKVSPNAATGYPERHLGRTSGTLNSHLPDWRGVVVLGVFRPVNGNVKSVDGSECPRMQTLGVGEFVI
jgi:hypothetical protein